MPHSRSIKLRLWLRRNVSLRALMPFLVFVSMSAVAHAQGTMDFSGATTLMGTFKKDGKYVDHTEWHRCVTFGKLGEFAASLKKGAHVQIEGELRSRKFLPAKIGKKQPDERTVWEIRVSSIRKLDRAAKATTEELEDVTPEAAA